MSTTRGIFEACPSPPETDSPFAIAPDSAPSKPAAFTGLLVASTCEESVPEQRRIVESPFLIAEPSEGFGVGTPTPAGNPFQAPPAPFAPPVTHFSDESPSDSHSIRQLELRAIFGVDRELSYEEMLQRARSLPGIQNVARIPQEGLAAIDSLQALLPSLGFASAPVKLMLGSTPLEFIREGRVTLAVHHDGGFAPGVRETLIIVARELGRLA